MKNIKTNKKILKKRVEEIRINSHLYIHDKLREKIHMYWET